MQLITSRSNRWVKLAEQLKHRKFRDKYAQFLMEGIRCTEDIQKQQISDVICFFTDNATQNDRVKKIIKKGDSLHWVLLCVTESIMKAITGTENTQGLLSIVNKKIYPHHEIRTLKGHYVLLDRIQDPGNMGTIIRTAAAAGCKGILLTSGCTDAYSEKAVRSSMGSILRLPIYEDVKMEELLELKTRKDFTIIGTSFTNAKSYREYTPFANGIIAFGNEGNGISEEILKLCDYSLYIPLHNNVESLNVTAAAAIILFHTEHIN